jgi:hypothetical protein
MMPIVKDSLDFGPTRIGRPSVIETVIIPLAGNEFIGNRQGDAS